MTLCVSKGSRVCFECSLGLEPERKKTETTVIVHTKRTIPVLLAPLPVLCVPFSHSAWYPAVLPFFAPLPQALLGNFNTLSTSELKICCSPCFVWEKA